MNVTSILPSIILTLGLILRLFLLVPTVSAAPDILATIRCVHPMSPGCYTTIQEALNASSNDDTIRVSEGVYNEQVLVKKSVVLQGGWNSTFTVWNWRDHITTINALGGGSAIYVDATSSPISPTIEGFHIHNGDASASLGWGGGILAKSHWDQPGQVTIRFNKIYENIACKLDTCQGYGGGIMIYSTRAIIEDNIIQDNIARSAGAGGGHGGGIAVWGWPIDAGLSRNEIVGNKAIITATGLYNTGEGGGLWSENAAGVTATSNRIRNNIAAEQGPGYGGGIYAAGTYYNNEITGNKAGIDGPGYGGGVYAYYTLEFHGNLVDGNVASQNDTGQGGGIYAVYLKEASGNTISNNRATSGGGLYYKEYTGEQVFYENTVSGNTANGLDIAQPDGGGGILSLADWLQIRDNRILGNTGLAGGGLLVIGGDRVLLKDNRIKSNLSLAGGGLYLKGHGGKVLHNHIESNLAEWWGGGLYLAGISSPELDRNIIVNNTASGYSGLAAGGVAIGVTAGTHVTMTNSIIARNTINSGVASGVHCYSGSCSLILCTIADNTFGLNPGEGVRIGAMGGANQVWNSIIAGHSTGVFITGTPTVSIDYNAFFDNTLNISSGTSPGAHALYVDPLFRNRLAGDYHLSSISPLINAGDSTLALPYDFEAEPRLLSPDIGADEYTPTRLYLPLLLKE